MPATFRPIPRMATDPRNRTITVSYPGGTVSAARGLLSYIFEGMEFRWTPRPTEGTGEGSRRLKYGQRQRSNAKQGRVHYLKLDDGKTYTVRVTGTTTKFIDEMIRQYGLNKVEKVWTQSGTEASAQYGRFV